VIHSDLDESVNGRTYDSIVLINVLEHIQDDAVALKQLAGALKPGGRLVLWVPALPRLYSDFDRRVGHFRRYRLRTLADLVESAGLAVVDARYVNVAGALAWWVLAKKLGQVPTTSARVRLFDRAFVPIVRRLESVRRPPFGQSIFCAARLAE
jgi:SAM-dependent methyltransferase